MTTGQFLATLDELSADYTASQAATYLTERHLRPTDFDLASQFVREEAANRVDAAVTEIREGLLMPSPEQFVGMFRAAGAAAASRMVRAGITAKDDC